MLVCRRFLELATGGTVNCKSIIPNKLVPTLPQNFLLVTLLFWHAGFLA